MVLLDSFGSRSPIGDAGRLRRWLADRRSRARRAGGRALCAHAAAPPWKASPPRSVGATAPPRAARVAGVGSRVPGATGPQALRARRADVRFAHRRRRTCRGTHHRRQPRNRSGTGQALRRRRPRRRGLLPGAGGSDGARRGRRRARQRVDPRRAVTDADSVAALAAALAGGHRRPDQQRRREFADGIAGVCCPWTTTPGPTSSP